MHRYVSMDLGGVSTLKSIFKSVLHIHEHKSICFFLFNISVYLSLLVRLSYFSQQLLFNQVKPDQTIQTASLLPKMHKLTK